LQKIQQNVIIIKLLILFNYHESKHEFGYIGIKYAKDGDYSQPRGSRRHNLRKGKIMEKRYICKNASCKYNGSNAKRIRTLLVKRQYFSGSTYVSKDDFDYIGDSINRDFEALGKEKVVNKFPKFDKLLF